MEKELKIKISVDKNTGAIKVVDGELRELSNSANKAEKNVDSFGKSLGNVVKAAGGLYVLKQAFDEVIGVGFEYNRNMEQSIAGIAALNVATSSNISTMGKSLSITEKYTLAQQEAAGAASDLAKINAQTPHTLIQTNQIYKAMYVSMKNNGASTKEMIDLTKQISIASGAAGIEFNSLLAGVDGLATGTVLANSDLGRFLNGLGLTNEALKETDDVVDLLQSKLSQFTALDTMTVNVSNLTNEWEQLMGVLSKDIFEATKEQIKNSASWLAQYRGQVHAFLLQFKDAQDIKTIEDINIRLIQLQRDLADEQNKSTTFMWNNDKKIRNERIKSIQEEIKLLKDRANASKNSDTLAPKVETISEKIANSNTSSLDAMSDKILRDTISKENKIIEDKKEKEISLAQKLSDYQLQLDYDRISAKWDYEERIEEEAEKSQSDFDQSWDNSERDDRLQEITLYNEALAQIQDPLDTINDKFMSMHDIIQGVFNDEQMAAFYKKWQGEIDQTVKKSDKYEGIGSKDWTAGLKGQYKDLANIGNAFADIGEEQEKWDKFSKDGTQTEADKNQHLQNQIGLYSNLAGAIGGAFEENSTAAKAMAVIDGVGAVIKAWNSAPFPYNLPAVAITGASVASLLSDIGESAPSGGGVSPYSISEQAGMKITELEDNTLINELEDQTALLEAIERNGSKAALNVELAKAEFNQAKNQWVQEVFDDSRMGWINSAFTDIEASKKYIEDYYSGKELVNPYEIQGNNIRISSEKFRENPDDLIAVIADMSNMISGQDFSYTGPFGQKIAEELGFSEDAHEAFLASIKSSFSDLQSYLNDWTIGLVDSVSELGDASDTLKDSFDEITGTAKYETQRLNRAFSEFSDIAGGNTLEHYTDYIEKNIENIIESQEFVDKLSGVKIFDETTGLSRELTNLELLMSKSSDLISEQTQKVAEFSDLTGRTFENGAKEALDYIDSIELVAEAMAISRENIKSFEDSFKTEQELAQDMLRKINPDLKIANNIAELADSFNILKGGLGGLTDAELEFLEANKDLISFFTTTAAQSAFSSIQEAAQAYKP